MKSQEASLKSNNQVVSDLRRNYLSFPETLAQSIANIAPTATPALALPLVAANAGNGTWLVYLIATIGLILVGLNISTFARRLATTGSMYTYITKSLGPTTGFLSGWGLFAAYLFTAMATLLAFGIFGEQLFAHLGIKVPTILLFAIGAGTIWYLSYRDIRLSSMLALFLEFISVILIAVLGFVVVVKNGFQIDFAQLSLQDVSLSGMQLAMVLAVFSYVGFESAATLGKESRNPLRSIPKAIVISTFLVGLFFALTAYMEVLGFAGGAAGLKDSEAPLNELAVKYNMGWFGVLIEFGALISFFSCSLASINAASRILYAMGRDKIFHESVGSAHSTNQTPHVAVTVSSLLNFLVPTLLLGIKPLDAYGYLGTIATYGFLLTYILVSIAAPVYMYREHLLRPHHVLLGAGGIFFMMIPLIGSFYPVPSAPYNMFPYFFIAYLLLGAIWFIRSNRKNYVTTNELILDMETNSEMIS